VPPEDLQSLRDRIRAVDRRILELVTERMRIAQSVGDYKRRAGLPIRDYRTEVEVLERTRRACEELGLDADLGLSVIQSLIEGAVRTQHGIGERPYEGSRRSILVVGGGGRMGAWLCRYFAGQGHSVTILDPSPTRLPDFQYAESLAAAREADVVALATPLERTGEVLDELTALDPKGLVFDICSLKSPIFASIRNAAQAGVRIASLHPLFAPGTVLLAGRVLVVCDCGVPDATRDARALFEDTALRLVDLPLDEHDRRMAYVLGLSHAVNIAFGTALRGSGLSAVDFDRVASTTFSKQVRTTREVALENPRLYYEIQHGNRHTGAVLDALLAAVRELRAAALAETPDAFEGIMQSNHSWFQR